VLDIADGDVCFDAWGAHRRDIDIVRRKFLRGASFAATDTEAPSLAMNQASQDRALPECGHEQLDGVGHGFNYSVELARIVQALDQAVGWRKIVDIVQVDEKQKDEIEGREEVREVEEGQDKKRDSGRSRAPHPDGLYIEYGDDEVTGGNAAAETFQECMLSHQGDQELRTPRMQMAPEPMQPSQSIVDSASSLPDSNEQEHTAFFQVPGATERQHGNDHIQSLNWYGKLDSFSALSDSDDSLVEASPSNPSEPLKTGTICQNPRRLHENTALRQGASCRNFTSASMSRQVVSRPDRPTLALYTDDSKRRAHRLNVARQTLHQHCKDWRTFMPSARSKLWELETKQKEEQQKRLQLLEGIRLRRDKGQPVGAAQKLLAECDFRISLAFELSAKWLIRLHLGALRINAILERSFRKAASTEAHHSSLSLQRAVLLELKRLVSLVRNSRSEAVARSKHHDAACKQLFLRAWATLTSFKGKLYEFASKARASQASISQAAAFGHLRAFVHASRWKHHLEHALSVLNLSALSRSFLTWFNFANKINLMRSQLVSFMSSPGVSPMLGAPEYFPSVKEERVRRLIQGKMFQWKMHAPQLKSALASIASSKPQMADGIAMVWGARISQAKDCWVRTRVSISEIGVDSAGSARESRPGVSQLARRVRSRKLLMQCVTYWSEEPFEGACQRVFAARRLQLYAKRCLSKLVAFAVDARKLASGWRTACVSWLKRIAWSGWADWLAAERSARRVTLRYGLTSWIMGKRVEYDEMAEYYQSWRRSRLCSRSFKAWAAFQQHVLWGRRKASESLARRDKRIALHAFVCIKTYVAKSFCIGAFRQLRELRMSKSSLIDCIETWRCFIQGRRLLCRVFSTAMLLWEHHLPQESDVYASMFQAVHEAFGVWIDKVAEVRAARRRRVLSTSAITFFKLRAASQALSWWHRAAVRTAGCRRLHLAIGSKIVRRKLRIWICSAQESLEESVRVTTTVLKKWHMRMLAGPSFRAMCVLRLVVAKDVETLGRLFHAWRRAADEAICLAQMSERRQRKILEDHFEVLYIAAKDGESEQSFRVRALKKVLDAWRDSCLALLHRKHNHSISELLSRKFGKTRASRLLEMWRERSAFCARLRRLKSRATESHIACCLRAAVQTWLSFSRCSSISARVRAYVQSRTFKVWSRVARSIILLRRKTLSLPSSKHVRAYGSGRQRQVLGFKDSELNAKSCRDCRDLCKEGTMASRDHVSGRSVPFVAEPVDKENIIRLTAFS
jgi:hypothetical protein